MKKTLHFILTIGLIFFVFIGTAGLALADDDTSDPYAAMDLTVTPDGYHFHEESGTIFAYGGDGGDIVIPSSINGVAVEIIVNSAFSEDPYNEGYIPDVSHVNPLTTVVIPSSVKVIEPLAFSYCASLTSINIPNGVTDIAGAFKGCESLTIMSIPGSVLNMEHAFGNCASLTSIDVSPDNPNYSSISGVLYNKDQSTIIKYPAGKSETSYTIPTSVTLIDSLAFSECEAIESVTIPSSVIEISGSAFEWCKSLSDVSLSIGLEKIGIGAFFYCESLTSITIPSSVHTISRDAFFGSLLTSIFIPASVTSMESGVFEGCESLASVTVDDANTDYCSVDGVLFTADMSEIMRYPSMKSDTSYAIPSGVEEIGRAAFDYCQNLTSITIPSGVTVIGLRAFKESNTITEISIPSGVTHISDETFKSCDSLVRVDIPRTVDYISNIAFRDCNPNLTIYGTLGSYAQGYADRLSIPFCINFVRSEDTIADGMLCRTYFNESDDVVCSEYYRGTTDASARIQSDYYNYAGTMLFTEIYDETDTIIASVWFQSNGVTKRFKNYYNNGTLYFQEEYNTSDVLIASIWFQPDGETRHFKNYYDNGTLYFQEEYDVNGDMIASIWFQSDGETRNFKNYYNGYLYFQEEYNTDGTLIASINFRSDGSRERKCYYKESDGSLYLIEYYDENGDLIGSEWY